MVLFGVEHGKDHRGDNTRVVRPTGGHGKVLLHVLMSLANKWTSVWRDARHTRVAVQMFGFGRTPGLASLFSLSVAVTFSGDDAA